MKKLLSLFVILILVFTTLAVSDTSLNKLNITVPLKENSKTVGEKVYEYALDWAGIVISVFGLFVGFKILRKKLLENHISKALDRIQETNHKILTGTTILFDDFSTRTFKSGRLQKEELEDVITKIEALYITSQGGSSECETLLFYLKRTLQFTNTHYLTDKEWIEYIPAQSLYNFCLTILEKVSFYVTQVVPVPKSGKVHSQNLFNKKLSKLIKDPKYKTYRHFRLGLIPEVDSAINLLFTVEVNGMGNTLVQRSAFKVNGSNKGLLKLLYYYKIYAPLVIAIPNESLLADDSAQFQLFLVGFIRSKKISDNEPKTVIDLVYANPIDNLSFVESTTKPNKLEQFQDTTITDSGFRISKTTPKQYRYPETIKIEFDLSYLQELFEANRTKIKAHLGLNNSFLHLYQRLTAHH